MLKTVRSLNKLVGALHQSLPAVSNAFLLVLLVCCLFSIVASRLFGSVDAPYFMTFGASMFTFWMLMTFDNACSVIQGVYGNFSSYVEIVGISLFFITFQLLVGYILMNIVMAVLLTEFTDSSARSQEEQLEKTLRKLAADRAGPLDMLLDRLFKVQPKQAVEQELQALFELIDEDGSGSIDLLELQQGLRDMEMLGRGKTEDEEDFETFMMKKGLHRSSRLSFSDFRKLIREELDDYELRSIDFAVQNDYRISAKVNTALRAMGDVLDAARKIRPIERRLASYIPRLESLESAAHPALFEADQSWKDERPDRCDECRMIYASHRTEGAARQAFRKLWHPDPESGVQSREKLEWAELDQVSGDRRGIGLHSEEKSTFVLPTPSKPGTEQYIPPIDSDSLLQPSPDLWSELPFRDSEPNATLHGDVCKAFRVSPRIRVSSQTRESSEIRVPESDLAFPDWKTKARGLSHQDRTCLTKTRVPHEGLYREDRSASRRQDCEDESASRRQDLYCCRPDEGASYTYSSRAFSGSKTDTETIACMAAPIPSPSHTSPQDPLTSATKGRRRRDTDSERHHSPVINLSDKQSLATNIPFSSRPLLKPQVCDSNKGATLDACIDSAGPLGIEPPGTTIPSIKTNTSSDCSSTSTVESAAVQLLPLPPARSRFRLSADTPRSVHPFAASHAKAATAAKAGGDLRRYSSWSDADGSSSDRTRTEELRSSLDKLRRLPLSATRLPHL